MTYPLGGSHKLLHEPPLMHNLTWMGTSTLIEVERMIACIACLYIGQNMVLDALFFELPSGWVVVCLV